MTRRDWLKRAAAASGAALLPDMTGVFGAQTGPPGAIAAVQPAPATGRERLRQARNHRRARENRAAAGPGDDWG